jgi:hypothetical protein
MQRFLRCELDQGGDFTGHPALADLDYDLSFSDEEWLRYTFGEDLYEW